MRNNLESGIITAIVTSTGRIRTDDRTTYFTKKNDMSKLVYFECFKKYKNDIIFFGQGSFKGK